MAMQKNTVPQVELSMLPVRGQALSMDNVIILMDNLDRNENPHQQPPSKVFHPIKMMFYGLFLCLDGEFSVTANLSTYKVRKGDLFITHPGMIVNNVEFEGPVRSTVCFISEEAFLSDSKDRSYKIIHKNSYRPLTLPLGPDETDPVLKTYVQMRKVVENKEFSFRREVMDGYVKIIFAMIADWMLKNGDAAMEENISREEQLFLRFIKEVQAACTSERKISYYASKLCISPKYFAKLIYESSGKQASAWIRDYVILEAKAMLKTGRYTVQEVSDALNFPNSSFFGKYFKNATGMPPGKFINDGEKKA